MAYICKFVPATRNACTRICKVIPHRPGIQRNYWRRRDPFSELSSVVQSFENVVKEMDKEMNRVFGDFQRASPVKLPRVFSGFDRIREVPVISTDGDNKLYKLELEMEDMKPEDINITLRNNELTVTARRDEKRSDGSRFMRENTYHYTLPSEINPDTVRSSLSDGKLIIEAQMPALEESKEIPIKIESAQKTGAQSDSEKN